jgi:hypothetical protein
MAFIEGRRVRPGEVFELPDGMPPPANAEIVDDDEDMLLGKSERPVPGGGVPRTLSEMTRREQASSTGRGWMWVKEPGRG